MLPINTIKMRSIVTVNVIVIPVLKRACFISLSNKLPKKQPSLLWKPVCKTFQRCELHNLVKISLKLICLNNKKDKIDGKANSLLIEFQHAMNLCCAT